MNDQDHQGNTAMHLAVQRDHMEVVQLLIAAKADATIRNKQLWNCRAEASYGGTIEMLKLVLEADKYSMHRRFMERMPQLLETMKKVNFTFIYVFTDV